MIAPGKSRVMLTITTNIWRGVRIAAIDEGVTISALLERIIAEWLENRKGNAQ